MLHVPAMLDALTMRARFAIGSSSSDTAELPVSIGVCGGVRRMESVKIEKKLGGDMKREWVERRKVEIVSDGKIKSVAVADQCSGCYRSIEQSSVELLGAATLPGTLFFGLRPPLLSSSV